MKKISGRIYYMRKVMDYLGVAILLSLLYLLWILYQGPLSVPFLKPYIMQALNSEDAAYSMNIGEVNLELVRSIQPVKIIANDVIFRKNDENFTVNTPKLSLSFSIRALLKGIVAPSSVTFENPRLAIFTSYGVEQDKVNEVNKKKVQFYFDWFEGFLERFNSKDDIYPESFINEITVYNAEVEFHEVELGRLWRLKDVNFSFERNLTNLDISANGLLDMKDRLATLQIGADYQLFRDKLGLSFEFDDLVLSDLWHNDDENGLKINVPVKGQIKADIDFKKMLERQDDIINGLDAALEKISFNVTGSDGEVLFNDQEKFNYAIDSFVLDGTVSGGLNAVTIKNAEFAIGGQQTRLSLDVSGYKKYFFENSLDDLKIIFQADIDKFKLDDLSKFWPRYLAEPAWDWCRENLYGGYAENGKFVFSFDFDPEAQMLRLANLDGSADVVDGNISYLEGMPAVHHVYGKALFSSSSIDIDADKGVSNGVIITGGRVRLYDLDKAHNFIDIQIKGNSTMTDALKFIDHPPLNFAAGMGINPEKVLGDVEIALGLNFELHKNLQPEEIKVDVKADLSNVKVPDVAEGKSITAEKMALEVNGKGFLILGKAEFDGIPLDVVVNETFANRAYKSKGRFSFRLNEDVKKKLGISAAVVNPPYIDGYADVQADLTIFHDDKVKIDVDADLTHAAIDYSFLGFKKAKGQWGKIKTSLEFAGSKLKKVPSFSLAKSDFNLQGKMSIADDGQIKVIDIDQIKGPKTNAKAKIEFSGRQKRRAKINVSGNSYDMTELFARSGMKKSAAATTAKDDDFTDVMDSEIFIAVNSLWTNPETPIKNFAGSAVLINGVGVEEVHMVGNYGSDKSIKLKLDYIPRPGGEYLLSIDSNNAGSTLRVLRLYDNMHGGILKIEAKRTRNKAFIGHAQIRDFSIRNTPLMAKLLSVASFSGILDLLRGEGISFSQFSAPFEYRDKTLYINDARMFGNVIGFTGNGSYRSRTEQINIKGIISPAYSLNSMLGKIPLVGTMLAGKDGTVFAANYDIKGSLDDPKISINPLSVFSPNSLKDVFSSWGNN